MDIAKHPVVTGTVDLVCHQTHSRLALIHALGLTCVCERFTVVFPVRVLIYNHISLHNVKCYARFCRSRHYLDWSSCSGFFKSSDDVAVGAGFLKIKKYPKATAPQIIRTAKIRSSKISNILFLGPSGAPLVANELSESVMVDDDDNDVSLLTELDSSVVEETELIAAEEA